MSVSIGEVRGVTPDLSAKLQANGIRNSDQLLQECATPAARRALAEKLGMEPKMLLELANRADLIRIKGVAGAYSDLLENAGVDTVSELSRRVSANLQARLKEINDEKKITTRIPTADMVADWVAEAKTLPKILQY